MTALGIVFYIIEFVGKRTWQMNVWRPLPRRTYLTELCRVYFFIFLKDNNIIKQKFY